MDDGPNEEGDHQTVSCSLARAEIKQSNTVENRPQNKKQKPKDQWNKTKKKKILNQNMLVGDSDSLSRISCLILTIGTKKKNWPTSALPALI